MHHRNLPIAIFTSCILVTVVYTMTIIAFHSTLSVSEVLSAEAVAVVSSNTLRPTDIVIFDTAIDKAGPFVNVCLWFFRLLPNDCTAGWLGSCLSLWLCQHSVV